MKNYFLHHCHSHFSLDGLSKPEHIAQRVVELNMDGCSLTDHANISGSIEFIKEMKKVGKKPIIGCELYISEHDATIKNENNKHHSHLVVLAQNDVGWKNLIQLTSEANKPENFYYKPRLSLAQLAPFAENLIAFAGHMGSIVANEIINRDGHILHDGIDNGSKMAYKLKEIFGENFYLECQIIEPCFAELVEGVRKVSQQTNIPCLATADAHYAHPEQQDDHAVKLATILNKTLQECANTDVGFSAFFRSNAYHIPSYDEMLKFGNTEEELERTLEVAQKCDEYKKVLQPPIMPPFDCPEGYTHQSYLEFLCQEGWQKKIVGKVSDINKYVERLNMELKVIKEAKLASYFLVIADILSYVKSQKWLAGTGRGSASGCLISYLIGITGIDPIKYDLYFERFFSAGRLMPDAPSFEECPFSQFLTA